MGFNGFKLIKVWDWHCFAELLAANEHVVLGLMSGTSADGLDMALVKFTNDGALRFNILDTAFAPHPPELRSRILSAYSNSEGDVELITKLNFELSKVHGRMILDVIGERAWDFDVVAYHGQTVYHLPTEGATLQIGEPDVLAIELGRPVVYGFRTKDVALGGQGAPISAYFDACYFLQESSAAVLNVGGISNVTLLGPDGKLVAFDTGPGNCLVDLYVSWHFGATHDIDGSFSSQGTVHQKLLGYLLELAREYVVKPPPKTTGREVYSSDFLKQTEERFKDVAPHDFVRTLIVFTAMTVRENLRTHAPHIGKLVVFGGGAHNPTLLEELKNLGFELEAPEPKLVDFREAVAIAFLGELFVRGLAFSQVVTGAMRPSVLGKLAIPT